MAQSFTSGFVSIIGKPNVGKSTLMNALVGERISIITPKAQTTRHRIFGIVTGEDFQFVYSDTPGVLDPKYKLQESMMHYVMASLEDADLVLYLVEYGEKVELHPFLEKIITLPTPLLLLINKSDKVSEKEGDVYKKQWESILPNKEVFLISALKKTGLNELLLTIKGKLPIHPPYFPEDALTDKSERFITEEIIREKIFLNYEKEIPYSCEVVVESFKEAEDIIRIQALIFVERDSQKSILIGHKGESLKKVGIQAREALEAFFQKKIFISTFVKVEKDWRKNANSLKRFGYLQ